MVRLILQFTLGVCVVLSAVGCQPAVYTDYAAFVREPRPTSPGQEYRVGAADTLVVTIQTNGELVETSRSISPDGSLWVEGFEPVTATGRAAVQIAGALNEQMADADPARASVRVSHFASQKIFVFGQVAREGSQPYHGANTVLDAVAAAQLNARADPRHVQVLRPSADGEFRRRLTVDFEALVQNGDSTLNVVLADGDVVFVPPTGLGSIGLAMDQLFGGSAKRQTSTESLTVTDTAAPAVIPVAPPINQDLETLRESLSQVTYQLEQLRDTQTQLLDTTQELASQTAQSSLVQHNDSPPSPPTSLVVFTTAEVQRGGAGESPRREGVRFWGP